MSTKCKLTYNGETREGQVTVTQEVRINDFFSDGTFLPGGDEELVKRRVVAMGLHLTFDTGETPTEIYNVMHVMTVTFKPDPNGGRAARLVWQGFAAKHGENPPEFKPITIEYDDIREPM